MELLLDEVGDGRLAGAGEAGEPQDARPLALERRRAPRLSTSSACQWMLVARRRPKRIMPAATVALVKRSIRMKEPVVAVVVVEVEGDRLGERQIAEADVVERQRLGGERLEGLDVDLVLELAHRGADGARRRPSGDRSGRAAAAPRHPDEVRGDLVGDLRPVRPAATSTSPRLTSISRSSVSVTASPARGLGEVAVDGDDARDRAPSGRCAATTIASPGRDAAAGDGAGIAAEVGVRPVDPLHRKAERLGAVAVARPSTVSRCSSSVGPRVPGRARAPAR